MARQSVVRGAAILALAGITARIIGAFFRIVLAMLIGDEGVGLFQMAYPVYGTVLAVSSAGIPIAISKLVSEKLAGGDYQGAYRVFRVALIILSVSGFVLSGVLFSGADFFAREVARDARAYLPLVSIAPAVFFVTVMSAYRGFFQGQQQMLPTALSQVFEQVGRVLIALLLVVILMPRGLEHAAAGASFGAVAGALAGLLVLILIWRRQRPGFFRRLRERDVIGRPVGSILADILKLSIPISLGSLVVPLIAIVDLSIVPQRLHAAGFDTGRATALYGQLTGMASPLVHIPTIITVALAISLVPAISEARALKNIRLIRDRSFRAVRLTLLLGLPSAAGLYLLAEPITVLLFDQAEAGMVLAALAPSVLLLTFYQTTSAILQGLGHPSEPVKSLFCGALVKMALTWYLTADAQLHIRGAAYATVVGFALAALLNLQRLGSLSGLQLRLVDTLVKPIIACTAMGLAVISVYGRLNCLFLMAGPAKANGLAGLSAIASGVLVYALVLFLLGAVTSSDLETIPRVGPVLARAAKKLRLLRE